MTQLKAPLIIVNFKTYETAVGRAAIVLAQLHEQVAKETGVNIGIAVGALDLAAVAATVSIPVFAQHVDAATYGSYTGGIAPAAVKAAGAVGTLLNHSERRLGADLPATIATAKKAGLTTIVCTESAEEVGKLTKFQPDYLAVEPPELIGGDISVTTANPEIITNSLAKIGQTPLLVGAGVKTGADVATAVRLGAAGVLLASGVTKATDPKKVLRELVLGLS